MNPESERKGTEGKKKALIVAISDYINLQKLNFCQRDGEEMFELLTRLEYEIPVRLIGNIKSDVMKDAIYDFFSNPRIKSDDTLLFYYSGHGVPDIDGDIYLASCEVEPDSPFKKGFSFYELTKMMQRSISTKIVSILDCCYSGAARVSKGYDDAAATLGTAAMREKSKILHGEGKCILAASQATQEAYKLLEGDNSIFTHYLLRGLKGDQNSVDIYGNVTPDSLGRYIFREIANLPAEKKPKQTPMTKTEVAGDIILAYYPELARPAALPKDQVSIMIEEANNYYSTGKYNEAIQCYDRVIEIDPDNVVALNNKGRLLCELEKYHAAIECYDRAIEIDPDNPSTYRGKADVYKRKTKLGKLIAQATGGGAAAILGISLIVPFPLSVLLIGVALFVFFRALYKRVNRNSQKCLLIAKKLEMRKGIQSKDNKNK
jgi:tetratricopeptide (TPR) repeat protein